MPGSEEIATTRLDEAAKTAAASLDGRIAVGLNDELWNLVSLVIDAKENGSGVQLGTSTAAVSAALRFVRNACAGVSANQERATSLELHSKSLQFIKDSLSSQQPSLDLAAVWVQAVANMVTGNEDTQEIVWPWLLEAGQTILPTLLDLNDPRITPAVLILTHNTTFKKKGNTARLVGSTAGQECLKCFLRIADLHVEDDHSPTFDLACLVLGNVIDLGLSSSLITSLAPPPELPTISHEEYAFLKLLDGRLESTGAPTDLSLLSTLSTLLKRSYDLATDIMFGFRDRIQELPEGIPEEMAQSAGEHDLESLILLLRYIGRVSQELLGSVKGKWAEGTELVGTLIALLKDLNAAQPRRKPDPTRPPSSSKSKNPLFLLKSDVVNAIGNLSFRCKAIQDDVRERGGLVMVLDQCNLDDENPFIREQAILAIRNLLENNLENQDLIRSMEAKQVLDEKTLDELGVEAQIDESGKIKLGKAPPK